MNAPSGRWRSFFIGVVFVAVAAGLNSLYLHDLRLYQYLEEINFDSWIRAHPDAPSPNIHIFAIDDAGYKLLFREKSPLDPERVAGLIQLAAVGGAKVIGVDIDTSEWTAEQWKTIDAVETPLVLATADESQSGAAFPVKACLGSAELAAAGVHHWDKRNETGVIRTHPGTTKPAFSDLISVIFKSQDFKGCRDGSIAEENKKSPGKDPVEERAAYIRSVKRSGNGGLEPDFTTWSVAKLPWGRKLGERDRWSLSKPVSGKAVLIGGTARKLHDFHEGPFGLESGIALQAEMVNSRLTDHPIHPLSPGRVCAIDFAIGLALLAVVSRWPPLGRPLFLPFLFGILAFISFELFRWSGLFLGFLTVFVGILLHKFAEFYLEHRTCHGR